VSDTPRNMDESIEPRLVAAIEAFIRKALNAGYTLEEAKERASAIIRESSAQFERSKFTIVR
jgi:hypothetical protein